MIKVSERTKKVSFELSVQDVDSVAVVGDFNNWDRSATPMKYNKRSGVWKAEVPVTSGVHEFRYLVNESEWINDDAASTVPNAFGTLNNVVEVAAPKAAPAKATAAKAAPAKAKAKKATTKK